jgi:hypothetical protein
VVTIGDDGPTAEQAASIEFCAAMSCNLDHSEDEREYVNPSGYMVGLRGKLSQ